MTVGPGSRDYPSSLASERRPRSVSGAGGVAFALDAHNFGPGLGWGFEVVFGGVPCAVRKVGCSPPPGVW